MKKPLHLSIGSFNIDLIVFIKSQSRDRFNIEKILLGPGGSAVNYAVAAVTYGHRASLIAASSSSKLALRNLNRIEKIGVETKYVKMHRGKPGLSLIVINHRRDTKIYEFLGVNKELSRIEVDNEVFNNANVLYIGSLKPGIAGKFVDQAYRKGILITYDPGSSANLSLDKLSKILSRINILFINKDSFLELTKGDVDKLFKYGVDKVVVRKGVGSAVLFEHGGIVVTGYSKTVGRVRNIIGSSDAFNAFFNSVYIDTGDPYKALQYALAASVLKSNCTLNILCYSRDELSKYLSQTFVEIVKEGSEVFLEE
ncbi:MAG: carbohydrate kinase family protein [Desulfurococcaceae archaeon]|uniref:Carbohydrate kinase family protein n=2 Tax=Staphylothermus marinus TaxID=2280 RepID=A0A7C4JL44_STAMA